jgi:hypothetical protein
MVVGFIALHSARPHRPRRLVVSNKNAVDRDVQCRQVPPRRGSDLAFHAGGQWKRPLQGKSELGGRCGGRMRVVVARLTGARCFRSHALFVLTRRFCLSPDRKLRQHRRPPRASRCDVGFAGIGLVGFHRLHGLPPRQSHLKTFYGMGLGMARPLAASIFDPPSGAPPGAPCLGVLGAPKGLRRTVKIVHAASMPR